MNFSKAFIDRPIATALVMAAILLAGALAFTRLPVSALPHVDFPTIQVQANLPGANPETMASSVATPLERQFAQIPGLAQMTSTSQLGQVQIALQFDLDKNIDSAAQDVQSAINAAGGQLPKNLPNPPTWRKTNPADKPVMIIGGYSDVAPVDQVDDVIDTKVAQQLSQIPGVGQVVIMGERKPAVRVQINPAMIAYQGLSLEDVRAALAASSVDAPKGSFNGRYEASTLDVNDQILSAKGYQNVIVAYKNGAPVRISDIGTAVDSVENLYGTAWVHGVTGIQLGIFRLPDANVIEVANLIKARLPQLLTAVPEAIHVDILQDRTLTIRASVDDIEFTLMITIGLVIMVIFLFLRKLWGTVIPAVAVPLSLVGTFGVMFLMGYGLDNLSLMALTISVGFVVDDAIVMIENIVRYIEQGESPYQAAVKGAGQIGFTIISITFSLIAVFIPLLLMGGIIGRLFHEFAVTVSVAVLISAFISLTLTPTMCARFLGRDKEQHARFYVVAERVFDWMVNSYARLLRIVMRHQLFTLASLFAAIGLSGFLFTIVPKGFFPQQDTSFIQASTEGAQNISFQEMARKEEQALAIVAKDPAVDIAPGNIGSTNRGNINIYLKPWNERDVNADQVINRLRPKLAQIEGFKVLMQSAQDITVGARFSRTQFQYTLQDQDIDELNHWSDVMLDKLQHIPQLQDVATDQQNSASRSMVKVDRDAASRLGIQLQQIDDTLYDAFGQRQVATIFTQLNQYHVVLEVDPQFQQDPAALQKIYVKSASGAQVPLGAFTALEPTVTSLAISHQGQFPAVTLSFNLSPGVALGDAVTLVQRAEADARMPPSVTATFQGNAQAFQDSLSTIPFLILAALVAVYIVLGILYESFIHPLTILSTLPSAGVGALLMLWIFHYPLDVMALIGIILLIGIVKKNAIMMIDFALEAERHQNMSPEDSIYHAALLRFRPIMMTTMAALFSGLPLMLGRGAGSELRQPLGYAIVGGLILSQMLTLFTTPVVYLYLDRFGAWLRGGKTRVGAAGQPVTTLPGAAE